MEQEEQGLLLKGIGGFYYVSMPDGEELACKARGKLRRDGAAPMPGDRVTVERQQTGHAWLTHILPRKNMLLRPTAANIDQLVIVVSAGVPEPDLLLTDKLMLQCRQKGIVPILAVNKCDSAPKEAISDLQAQYRGVCEVLCLSALTGEGVETLSQRLAGKVSCFAGQSAVGKSSLLNRLLPALSLPTGGLTRKTDRGKHTTRHAELWPYRGGGVMDTPGFSLLDLPYLEQAELDRCYPEFGDAPKNCRFPDCSHVTEPDCGVRALLQTGRLSPARYERYTELYQLLQERKKRQYD